MNEYSEAFLPLGRSLVAGQEAFPFHCHANLSCYLSCCRNVVMLLFPYDIILLKNRLNIRAADFLQRHTTLCDGSHPYFPGLQLKLAKSENAPCPFLTAEGCGVYRDRPSACRTYPLERGVERREPGQGLKVHYFMTHHPYCKGHEEARAYTLRQWERDQQLHDCNLYNDLWAELDAFFATNPWAGEGKAGPRQRLAFMACYDIDSFRDYEQQHQLTKTFLNKEERKRVLANDGRLLTFAFTWLEQVLGGRRQLVGK